MLRGGPRYVAALAVGCVLWGPQLVAGRRTSEFVATNETEWPALDDAWRRLPAAFPLDFGRPKFTPGSPDSRVLRWTSGSDRIRRGYLTVLLDPSDPDSPRLELRVTMQLWEEQPAPKGPLLIHLGGPSTDDSACCKEVPGYDVWMISQRGIGPEANPALRCNNSHLPWVRKDPGQYVISDFTDCPCALPDGTPMVAFFWADLDPLDEAQVRHLFQNMAKRAGPCYQWMKFQLRGRGGKTYNFLDYVGTALLAQDIEVMRQAIGAQKMSIWGKSYGTRVGGVYATMFPGSIGRLILDGNLSPVPHKRHTLVGFAQGFQNGLDALLEQCEYNRELCHLQEPEEDLKELMGLARAGKLRAKGKDLMLTTPQFVLSIGMLLGYIHGLLRDVSGWLKAVIVMRRLLRRTGGKYARDDAVRQILDHFCVVKGVKTWYEYGVCVGPGQTAEAEGSGFYRNEDYFIEQTAIMSADMVGRYSVESALGTWRTVKLQYGEVGTNAFLGMWAASFRWPALTAPPPPLGHPAVPALVLGNFFDATTGYHWAQETRQAFPAGALMTWQGVGHCMPLVYAGFQKPFEPCLRGIDDYLLDGTLPQDGLVCRVESRGESQKGPGVWGVLGPPSAPRP